MKQTFADAKRRRSSFRSRTALRLSCSGVASGEPEKRNHEGTKDTKVGLGMASPSWTFVIFVVRLKIGPLRLGVFA